MRIVFIIFVFLYINLEVIPLYFSAKKYRYSKNFYAPVAKKINSILPSQVQLTEIDQSEFVWWYARDLAVYFKMLFLAIIAIASRFIQGSWAGHVLITLSIFALIELFQYVLFKNIFTMYYDLVVCDLVTLLFITNGLKVD